MRTIAWILVTLLLTGCAGVPTTVTVKERIPEYALAYGEDFPDAGDNMLYQGILIKTYGAWWSMPIAEYGSRNNQCRVADRGSGLRGWKTIVCFSRLDLNLNGGVKDGVFEYVFSDLQHKAHIYQWWDLRRTYYLAEPWSRWHPKWTVFRTNHRYLPVN